jgi:excisionase family DNA binding protein
MEDEPSVLEGTWLTVQEVAAHLKVTQETVRRWIRDGALPVLDLGGQKTGYRILRSELERFLAQRYGPAGTAAASKRQRR